MFLLSPTHIKTRNAKLSNNFSNIEKEAFDIRPECSFQLLVAAIHGRGFELPLILLRRNSFRNVFAALEINEKKKGTDVTVVFVYSDV